MERFPNHNDGNYFRCFARRSKFTHLFYANILKHICILTSLSIRLELFQTTANQRAIKCQESRWKKEESRENRKIAVAICSLRNVLMSSCNRPCNLPKNKYGLTYNYNGIVEDGPDQILLCKKEEY